MLTRIGFANDALHATVMTSCHYRTDASHSYANFSLNLLRVFPRRFMHRFPHSLGTPEHHTHHTQCTHSIQIYFFVVVIFQRFHYKFSLSSRALFSPNWIIFFCLALQCCHIFENIIVLASCFTQRPCYWLHSITVTDAVWLFAFQQERKNKFKCKIVSANHWKVQCAGMNRIKNKIWTKRNRRGNCATRRVKMQQWMIEF